MEGPTSSSASRNRITCLTLQEHDDDDDVFHYIPFPFLTHTTGMTHFQNYVNI